jgi:hypothetical protein
MVKFRIKITLISLVFFGINCSDRPPRPYKNGKKNQRGGAFQSEADAQNSNKKNTQNGSQDEANGNSGDASNLKKATGSLSISTILTPPANQGRYAPSHLQAVWVSDLNNNRIKTLSANPGRRSFHLRAWQKATAQDLDGLTGATIQDYSEDNMQITWDFKDKQGVAINEGKYRLWFELTESNTNDNFKDGDPGYAVYFVDFTVTSEASNLTDDQHPSFTQVLIRHTP